MSDKIRVNFFVNGQGVGKPTEISTEDYIHFMIGMRDGDNHALACYISGKFMKNKDVPENAVSMSKAVGVPMWVFDIDRAVANHEDTKLFQSIDGRTYGISGFDTDNYDSFDDEDDDDEDNDDDEGISEAPRQSSEEEDAAMNKLAKVVVTGDVISSIVSKLFWLAVIIAVLWFIFK